jgi:hypothetical protein
MMPLKRQSEVQLSIVRLDKKDVTALKAKNVSGRGRGGAERADAVRRRRVSVVEEEGEEDDNDDDEEEEMGMACFGAGGCCGLWLVGRCRGGREGR